MLICQLGALVATVVPRGMEVARSVSAELRTRRLQRNGAAQRFADAVRAAMAREPSIMERKYADRWLMHVHGRGLGGRPPMSGELGHSALPFAVMPRQLSRQLTLQSRQVTRQLTRRMSRRPTARNETPEAPPGAAC